MWFTRSTFRPNSRPQISQVKLSSSCSLWTSILCLLSRLTLWKLCSHLMHLWARLVRWTRFVWSINKFFDENIRLHLGFKQTYWTLKSVSGGTSFSVSSVSVTAIWPCFFSFSAITCTFFFCICDRPTSSERNICSYIMLSYRDTYLNWKFFA